MKHPAAPPTYAVCFDPGTITLALLGAGTVIDTVGQIQQGRAEGQRASFQAQVLDEQAERERQAGKIEAGRLRRDSSRLQATQRALLGGSGVDLASGTPLGVLANTAAEAEFEALLLEAGSGTRERRLRQEAALTRASGRQARRASFFRAGSSLLSGGAQFGLARQEFRRGLPQSRVS